MPTQRHAYQGHEYMILIKSIILPQTIVTDRYQSADENENMEYLCDRVLFRTEALHACFITDEHPVT